MFPCTKLITTLTILLWLSALCKLEFHEKPADSSRAGNKLSGYYHDLQYFYVLMIDAGSTGTRMHAFQFEPNEMKEGGSAPFALVHEAFKEVKPSLSSFADEPDKAALTLEPLLEMAKSVVPERQWHLTPLALRATAGLRLIPDHISNQILHGVRRVFGDYPFLIYNDSVNLMSGTDEGVFGWFTLNFYLDRVDPIFTDKIIMNKRTAVALDLGGGSTQITFRPRDPNTFKEAPAEFFKPFRLFDRHLQLYTHSYLGNGLIAARLGTLRMSTEYENLGQHRLQTSCMPTDFTFEWKYNGITYEVRGTEKYSVEECTNEIQRYIESKRIKKPTEILSRDVYAFSYYYDRSVQAGVIGHEGGWIKISALRDATKPACQRQIPDMGPEHWKPWHCLDVVYVYQLLSNGYGLPDTKHIFMAKKLQGKETSWALGAAYSLLDRHFYNHSIEFSYSQKAFQFCSYLGAMAYSSIAEILSLFQIFPW